MEYYQSERNWINTIFAVAICGMMAAFLGMLMRDCLMMGNPLAAISLGALMLAVLLILAAVLIHRPRLVLTPEGITAGSYQLIPWNLIGKLYIQRVHGCGVQYYVVIIPTSMQDVERSNLTQKEKNRIRRWKKIRFQVERYADAQELSLWCQHYRQ